MTDNLLLFHLGLGAILFFVTMFLVLRARLSAK